MSKKDYSDILKSTKVGLIGQAKTTASNYVADKAISSLKSFFGGNKSNTETLEDRLKKLKPSVTESLGYSAFIVNGESGFHPKYKFLFKVSFTFNPLAKAAAEALGFDIDTIVRDLTVVVKNASLPKVTYDFEQINYYNYWSKGLTKTNYDDLQITFFDSVGNHAMNFINAYNMLISPSSRVKQLGIMLTNTEKGFNFTGVQSLDDIWSIDTARRGTIPMGWKSIIDEITVNQFMVRPTRYPASLDALTFVNSFTYIKPQITSFDMSNVDAESSDNLDITMSFTYDMLNIMTDQRVTKDLMFPSVKGFDILDTPTRSAPSKFITNKKFPDFSGSYNPFTKILANAANKIVTRATKDLIAKTKLDKFAGGVFVQAINSSASILGAKASQAVMSARLPTQAELRAKARQEAEEEIAAERNMSKILPASPINQQPIINSSPLPSGTTTTPRRRQKGSNLSYDIG